MSDISGIVSEKEIKSWEMRNASVQNGLLTDSEWRKLFDSHERLRMENQNLKQLLILRQSREYIETEMRGFEMQDRYEAFLSGNYELGDTDTVITSEGRNNE